MAGSIAGKGHSGANLRMFSPSFQFSPIIDNHCSIFYILQIIVARILLTLIFVLMPLNCIVRVG